MSIARSEVPAAARTPRRASLRLRYAATFVGVVSIPLLLFGAISLSLTYRHQREALAALQAAQADASAVRIQQFLREVELLLGGLTGLPWTDDVSAQRRLEALRVMRQAPAITDLVLLDGAGRERVAESRLELGRLDAGADRSASPAFSGARARRVYHGDVYFRKGSEPFMTVAVAGTHADAGVAIAELSLKHIWEVVSRIRFGTDGIAYVVDRAGRLIAHPDINLVLRNVDLSANLRQLETAAGQTDARGVVALPGTRGREVLASSAVIASTGWRVVVEQPRDEADEPLYAAVRGALGVIAVSLLLAVAAALWSAWRMVRPLSALAASAERIGAGQLSHRIALHTGDELEQLGERFNTMARELQASYGSLERKVEERTRELSEAHLAKSRLLAAASHDLRQPLHALNLLVAQLRSEPEPTERDRLTRRVEAAVGAINGLFDGLLDVSRLDAGVVRPEFAEFAVQRILDRMDIAFSALARAKGLELRIRAHAGWVRSDPILLERTVGNLVANAVRYTRQGAVLVGCRRVGGALRIIVCDTGIGIPSDQLDAIFGEFYQVPSPTAGRGEGLGLGLSIVARLCALMGHTVDVRSAPGRGSCFGVRVPEVPPAPARAPQEPVADAAPVSPLQGCHVLLVDDNAVVLDSTARLLSSWGCHVQALASTDGLAGDLTPTPQLLLVDMHLGHGDDGVSLVQRVRARAGTTLPALVMTGDVSDATRQRISAAGLPMLEKPVTALRLRSALTRLLVRD